MINITELSIGNVILIGCDRAVVTSLTEKFVNGDGIIITLENTREQLDLTIDYTCKEKLFKEWIILSLSHEYRTTLIKDSNIDLNLNPAIGK